MRTEWSNKDSLEIPETTAGYGSVSWSDYKTGTSYDSVVLPIIEAEPVRHGHWVETKYPLFTCSECGAIYQDTEYGYNYCPNCGAKMDGERK